MLPEPDWSLIEQPLPTESVYQSKSQLTKWVEALTSELAMAKQVIKYREATEQANTAILMIQDMTLQKMNETLCQGKGKKTKT